MSEIRCECGKLLCKSKGDVVETQIKCTRCGKLVTVNKKGLKLDLRFFKGK